MRVYNPARFMEIEPVDGKRRRGSRSPQYLIRAMLGKAIAVAVGICQVYHDAGCLATRLVADRELWDVMPPSQPMRTLVLACPGVDAIRLWPMPMQQPWEED